jgi:hypothetical protein
MQVDGELPGFDPALSDMPHTHMHVQTLRRHQQNPENDYQKCQVWRDGM